MLLYDTADTFCGISSCAARAVFTLSVSGNYCNCFIAGFVSSHISISVVFSEQIPVYGSNFTMQCLVVLPVRFVSRPTKLSAQDQQSIPFGTPPFRDIFDSRVTNEGLVGNGNVYMQNNVFSPVLARDTDVKYRCSVTVNGITKNSNEFDLRIRRELERPLYM